MGGTTQWLSSMNPFVPKANIRGKRDTTKQQQQPASIRYLVRNIEFGYIQGSLLEVSKVVLVEVT